MSYITRHDLAAAADILHANGHELLGAKFRLEADRLNTGEVESMMPFDITEEQCIELRRMKNMEQMANAVRKLRDMFPHRSLRACMNYVRSL